MSCLLPQFRCQPDTFFIHFRAHPLFSPSSHSHLPKNKKTLCFRAHCLLSTTSPSTSSSNGSTAVLSLEKLALTTLDGNSDSVTTKGPWTYIGSTGPPTEASFKATLATESLITSEEAVIAAASSEALALAKAALKLAKDAAMLAKNKPLAESEYKPDDSSKPDNLLLKWVQDMEAEDDLVGVSVGSEVEKIRDWSINNNEEDSDDVEPTNEELESLEEQHFGNIAVRSKRQAKQKARRTRAAERASTDILSFKSGSPKRKKRTLRKDFGSYSDPLQYIRAAACHSKLLTHAEEIELSEGIQDLLKLTKIKEDLTERCGSPPTFAKWAAAAEVDESILRKRINHGTSCKDKMFKSNVRLVISIARKYRRAGVDIVELVQAGCRGLIRGAEKFDASKGFRFSTYAHWWIKQSVWKALNENSRTLHVPGHMVEAYNKVQRARKKLHSEGREATDEEIAKETGLSMKKLKNVHLIPKYEISLEKKIGIDGNLKPADIIADRSIESAEEMLNREWMKKDVDRLLDTLNPKERQVIRWRFGMDEDDGRTKTLQEIGEMAGVSRERIRQIELHAFRKIRRNTKALENLRQYLYSSS